jgi:hypothetical protein
MSAFNHQFSPLEEQGNQGMMYSIVLYLIENRIHESTMQ